jgi:hypothetical protein
VLDAAVRRQDPISLQLNQIRRVRPSNPEYGPGTLSEMGLVPGWPVCAFENQDDIDPVVSEPIDDVHEIIIAAAASEFTVIQRDADPLLVREAGQDAVPADEPGSWNDQARLL